MSCFRSVAARDGTSQRQRFGFDLDPDGHKIEDTDVNRFMSFLSRFSELINYYNATNQVDGDWKPFFTDEALAAATELFTSSVLNNTSPAKNKAIVTPHLSLLLVFFKLYQHLQHDLNGFTRRHLEYYFQEILGFKLRTGSPSNAFLLFELTRTAAPLALEAGTRFRAGKSLTGTDQFYRLEKDVFLNKATLAGVKSLFVHKQIIHPGTTLDPHRLFVSHVADSSDGKGAPLIKPENGWKPFGENLTDTTLTAPSMQPADLGFMISSPVLVMREGHREVILRAECKDTKPVTLRTSDLTDTVRAFYSTAKGWVPATVTAAVDVAGNACAIRINCLITVDKPAVEKFPLSPEAVDFDSPVLKVMFDVSSASSIYSKIQSLSVTSIGIFARVKGLKGVSLVNEQGVLDPSKPFTPFGAAPTVGSKLYIGSPEIFSKKLTDVNVEITWKGLPDAGLGEYYKPYFKKIGVSSPPWLENSDPAPFNNDGYRADLDLLQEGEALPLLTDFPFFNDPPDHKKPVVLQGFNSATLQRTKPNPSWEQLPPVNQAIAGGYMLLTYRGLIPKPGFTGIPAFGHAEFPSTFSDIAIGKAKGAAEYNNIALPNPPHTPTIQSMEISYEAKADIRIGEENAFDKFFHLEPFGIHQPEQRSASIPFVPQFHDEGYLYIGLRDLRPSQFVSMLFQLVEGSGNPDIPLEQGEIKWAYLAGNKWIALAPAEVVGEATQGFQKTGIVELSLGGDISTDHTLLPPGISWIRASVAAKADGASRLQKIFTQAALAVYDVSVGNDGIQLQDFRVAAETISKLEVSNSSIKKVSQPLPSFSGGSAELKTAFYTRVSERLRHRRRAINTWDYEHIILQAFPEIYKVKCIPHWKGVEPNFAGWVTVVLIPYPVNQNGEIRLEPKNSVTALRSVQDYLEEIIPSPVDVLAVNPVYERIFLDFKVSFLPALDGGYYGQVLNEELKELLSPWAFDARQDITFGGSVFKSDIINFIENREYVDFVTDFAMYSSVELPDGCPGLDDMRIIDYAGAPARFDDFTIADLPVPGLEEMELEKDFIVGQPFTLAIASTPLSVIVSAPAHRIQVLRPGESACSGTSLFGLGNMILEIDFEIATT